MKKNIAKTLGLCALMLCVASLGVVAYAEDVTKETPGGWNKGEKTGWKGSDVPPGLAKKDTEKASREAKKAKEKVDREAKKAKEKSDREAKKAAEKAKKEKEKQKGEAKKEGKKLGF